MADGTIHCRRYLLAVLGVVQGLVLLRPRLLLQHPRVEGGLVDVDQRLVGKNERCE